MSQLQHVAVAMPSSALGLLCLGTFSWDMHLCWHPPVVGDVLCDCRLISRRCLTCCIPPAGATAETPAQGAQGLDHWAAQGPEPRHEGISPHRAGTRTRVAKSLSLLALPWQQQV